MSTDAVNVHHSEQFEVLHMTHLEGVFLWQEGIWVRGFLGHDEVIIHPTVFFTTWGSLFFVI